MKNQASLLKVARIVTIFIGASAIVLALSFSNVVDLVIFAAGFWAPMILIPFIAGLFGIIISQIGFVITSLSGIISFIAWEHFMSGSDLKGVFVGTAMSFVVFALLSTSSSTVFID